ncbi:unnamed protein product, partial [Ectocarpus sp. 12 AP-2014]
MDVMRESEKAVMSETMTSAEAVLASAGLSTKDSTVVVPAGQYRRMGGVLGSESSFSSNESPGSAGGRSDLVPSDDAQFGDHDEDWARPPNSPNASPYMENHVDLDGDDDDDDDGTIPVHYGADKCKGQSQRDEEGDDEGMLALLPRRVARDPMEEDFGDDDASDGDDEGQAKAGERCSGGDGGGPSGPSMKRELSAMEQELGPETEDEELPGGRGLGSRSTSPSLSSSSSSEEGPSASVAAAAAAA